MTPLRSLHALVALLCLGLLLSACVPPQTHAARRREQLLAVYPPGRTTRTDVQKKWAPIAPELMETKPASGWGAAVHPAIRGRAAASEQRTGQVVSRCERYFGPDGSSGGLCYVWFYYDNRDHVVDAEWQWHTD